jgi:hypothetical protein
VTDLRIRGAARSSQVADVGVPPPRRPADPPLPDASAVDLSRLLRLSGLMPAQAVEVGADLLAALSARSNLDVDREQVIDDRVVIGADGMVALRPASDRQDGESATAGNTSGVAVVALLADIARAARLRARRAGPEAGRLLAELDRAAAELPEAGVPAMARTLGEVAAGIDRSAVRAELGALAQAIGRHAAPAPDARPAAGPPTAIRSGTAARATTGDHRSARRRVGAWLVSAVVLAGVLLLEHAVLRDKVATDIGVLLDAGRSGGTSSAAPKPDGLPVVPPAPAAAGSVRGVDLRPLAECPPGAPCTVRVLVRVAPAAEPQAVTWSYRIVDRCTGAVVAAPGGTTSVPAGQERVAVVGVVPLSTAPAVGVVAVTEVPAVAASAPLLVGSCTSSAG